jgi:colanic acid biosynthesis glycosyl transferase WcaI
MYAASLDRQGEPGESNCGCTDLLLSAAMRNRYSPACPQQVNDGCSMISRWLTTKPNRKKDVRRTLLVISQVYVPDPAAVGQHVADMAEEMARRGWRVVVYASDRGYDDPTRRYECREIRAGVEVRRLPFSSFGKSTIRARLFGQLLFMAQALMRGVCIGRLDAVVVSTSPPFAGAGGALISSLRRVPLLWWVMDLNPDQLVAAGHISPNSLFVRAFDWLNRFTLRQATAVVALDRFMQDRIVAKSPVAEKVHILPPWPHDDDLAPAAGTPEAFRAEHGLRDAFVVMYSGNHSPHNPLDTLLAASRLLVDDDRLRFVFIGGGTGKKEVDDLVAAGAPNVLSLPYQPKNTLGATLGAADIHVVSLGDSMVGIIHPCKIYGAMAIGRPILLFGPSACHATDIMNHDTIGWHVPHGDVAATVAILRNARQLPPQSLRELGSRARAIAADKFTKVSLLNRFCDLIGPAAGPIG